ncbi:MAG: RluA family pseudouridine synthase [Acidobacteria bacterium]|nr:RluA family pseudouridine synthase [Acidobacteriota bacterium]
MDNSAAQVIQLRAGVESDGRRLDEFLAARLDWLSRMRIATLLARGACTVNKTTAHAGQRLKAGDILEIALEEDAPNSMTPEPLPLDVVYEDAHLLVVNKPAGMLVHPTRGVKTGTLANALVYHLNQLLISSFGLPFERQGALNPESKIENPQPFIRPGLVHRLDRATSGLLVVAKGQRALSILSRHFHQRLVEKRYLALVRGCPPEDAFEINAPIGRDDEAQPKWRVLESGRHAETRVRVLERKAGLSLVELEPVTGRTNQLRIHCAHVGYPIVGDEWRDGGAATRLCLHAARLAFHHPRGGDWMEFTSPPPEEMRRLLDEEHAARESGDGGGS